VQLVNDILFQTSAAGNPLDLSANPKIEIDMMISSGSNHVITEPNVNKMLYALQTKNREDFTFIVAEQVMTPTAQFADIIFPICTHFENPPSLNNGSLGVASVYYCQNVIDPIYDSKPQAEFNVLFANACYEALGMDTRQTYTPGTEEDVKAAYEASQPMFFGSKVAGTIKPSWEEFKKKGALEYVIAKENTIRGMTDDFMPLSEGLDTTTGRINFFSPFWEIRNNFAAKDADGHYSAGWRTSTAKYIPVREGYEEFFENSDVRNGKFKGYPSHFSGSYTLQFTTYKARNRAHTVFSNVAIVRDSFVQTVKINPWDAYARQIKDGDMVYVYNDRGCTYIPAEVTYQIVPGVICIEHGSWYKPHPSEKIKVWQDVNADGSFREIAMPVDVGGSENILTDDRFTIDPVFVAQAISVHGGPCEVSKTLPANRRV
jgi:anaerobic dimethyl sulfoxide reductase subunit A